MVFYGNQWKNEKIYHFFNFLWIKRARPLKIRIKAKKRVVDKKKPHHGNGAAMIEILTEGQFFLCGFIRDEFPIIHVTQGEDFDIQRFILLGVIQDGGFCF
jgi:hypothetical protein